MPKQRFSIPKPVTSFVGRDDELTRLLRVIAPESTIGMVSLTGPGGAGKTRLALEGAQRLLEAYGGAITFVDLSELQPGSSIAHAVFDRLGLQEYADAEHEHGIALALEESRGLLILDNCEHVAQSAVALCEFLLQWVTQPHILCTSREILGVNGEVSLTVSPLSTTVDTPPPIDLSFDSVEPTTSNEAVRLFYDRAVAVNPDFVLTHKNVQTLIQLSKLLDGLPLAIELAAAQVRRFTPEEILANLQEHGLGLLARPKSTNPRHRTLDNAVAWSVELLSPRERTLYRRLAIFAGGWTLDAAKFVCCDDLVPETQLLTIMGNLLDKSLVMAEPMGPSSRCRMLGTIHHHASQALAESGEEATIAFRHLEWVRHHSSDALAGLMTRHSLAWMHQLDLEAENYAQALRRFVTRDPRRTSRIILNISQYWVRRQKLSELKEWTTALMAHPQIVEMPIVAARAHYVLGRTYGWMMRYFEAAEHYRQAIALAERAGDPALHDLARVSALHSISNAGDVEGALRFARELEREDYTPQDPWAIANYGLARGLLASSRGDYPAAMELLNQSVRGLRILGEYYLLTIALFQMGAAAQLAEKYETALAYTIEANENASKLGFQNLYLRTQLRLAELQCALGAVGQGLGTFEEAIALLNSVGEQPSAHVLRSLASIAVDQREWEAAYFLYSVTEMHSGNEHRLTLTGKILHDKRISAARNALDPHIAARLAQRAAETNLTEALLLGLRHMQNPGASSLQGTAPKLEIHIMGAMRVWVHGVAIADDEWKLQKARELLALLACGYENMRSEIEMLLWPEADGSQMRNRLNVALHSLRKTLGDSSCVEFSQNRYELAPVGGFVTDLGEFRQNVTAARSLATYDVPQAIVYLEQAVAYIRGPLLADLQDSDWFWGIRAQVQEEQISALNLLGTLYMRQQNFQKAADVYCRARKLDPLSEEAARGTMRANAAMGNFSRALTVYQNLVESLRKNLGVDPSEETTRLHSNILGMVDGEPSKTS